MRSVLAGAFVLSMTALPALASDWPQFMRDSAHTGDAADEALALPLGLVAQVRLDDAVMTSPAVVGGLVYVVDQMGTAYCVDPRAGRIVWKASPDAEKAMGSNTSSPCVAKGRMYFGTTAGAFHILDCKDGKVVKTVAVGSPVISSPTFANDSVYFQALDAVVRCLDLDGAEKWTWDHYKRYKEPPEITKAQEPARGHPGSYDRPHYGGGEVAVSGTKVVTSMGWDVFCLEDKGKDAELVWCRRCPSGRDGAAPMSSSISGEWIYTAGMGADGALGLMRFALKDGTNAKDGASGIPYFWITPAARGAAVATRNSGYWKDTVYLYDCEAKKSVAGWGDAQAATPVVSSQALAKDHVVLTTLRGDLVVFGINPKPDAKPLRLATPNGKGIGSAPAVSGGAVFFGCDDGCLYVYGPGGALAPKKDEKSTVAEPRSKPASPTGKAYGWTSTCGDAANTCFVDDPNLKPPLKVRWAARGFGHFKTPVVATAEGDVISVTLQRTVTCLEQATGRMRWRLRLPLPAKDPEGYGEEAAGSAGLLVADGRLFVPCPRSRGGKFFCLDVADGAILWSTDIGDRGIWDRASPVAAAGKVALGMARKGSSTVEAWDARTGAPAWSVELNVNPGMTANGCAAADVMYFSAGAEQWNWKAVGDRQRGQTVAIDAKDGKVIWKTNELFATCPPALFGGDRLFLLEFGDGPKCGVRAVSTKDGSLLWRGGRTGSSRISLGPDYAALRGYGGGAEKLSLSDGKGSPGLKPGGQLGGDTHACGAVGLTPNCSYAITVGGLNVRDAKTGELLWLSPGFAPRGCVNVALANGRVFWPSAASGVVFCWEPAK
jgi:outer membrane protein assembly factor BamB